MSNNSQPDWHKMAEKFDLWLPHIAPVGNAMLDVLESKSGDKILDIASGTGEPALTLARNISSVNIVGVDAAEGMVNVAQAKVEKEGLTNISFNVMPVEQLNYADNSFDHIICRFGVMLFQDPLAGLKEMYRVLKPGGSFVIAVWGARDKMPTMAWGYEAFKGKVSADDMPPLAIATSLGEPGVIDDILKQASFTDFQVERKYFNYDFKSFDEYWSLIESSDILKRQFDALAESEHASVRNEISEFADEFSTESGMKVPHEYLLVYGRK
ncbi:MAG: class I SAM-dependent methyltransferase [Gammaproteobacteria bacterium]|nr:class I SAM-dependent methyltransferase [Gammaproteobacteria bacterium]